jgi:tRNA(Ile)-lysidine synthase
VPMLDTIVADFLHAQGVNGRVTIALSGGVDSMVLLDIVGKIRDSLETAVTPAETGIHTAAGTDNQSNMDSRLRGNDKVLRSGESLKNDEPQYPRAFSSKNVSGSTPVLEFDALHVHHGLSPYADEWAAFCARECEARGITLNVVRVNVDRSQTDGQGVEGAARRARYAAFQSHGGATILAAQHADDQAETVLHQLLRGTGLNGLAGMGAARRLDSGQTLLRPLLTASRKEIEAWAWEHKVSHIEDDSNLDTTYTRNFLRHDVMPLLQSRFPHARASLARAARHAADSAELLAQLAAEDLQWNQELGTVNVGALDHLATTRQTNALYYWLRWQGVAPPSEAELTEWARQLFRASPTDRPHQAGGHLYMIRRKKDALNLLKVEEILKPE